MPVQTTQMYNNAYDVLTSGDITIPSALMWVLVTTDYNPLVTHTTASDLGGFEIVSPDVGQPTDATNVGISIVSTEGYFQAGTADGGGSAVKYGPGVMVFRYLVLVKPAVAGSYVADVTTDLIFYIDLIGSNSNDSTLITEYLTINMTSSGWFKMVQA